jgi:hypothetical protein
MALMAESGCLEQVDRGADNHTLYYTNYHETHKGGQGPVWAVAPMTIISRMIVKVRIPKKVLNMKVKGAQDQDWNKRLGEMSDKRKGDFKVTVPAFVFRD